MEPPADAIQLMKIDQLTSIATGTNWQDTPVVAGLSSDVQSASSMISKDRDAARSKNAPLLTL